MDRGSRRGEPQGPRPQRVLDDRCHPDDVFRGRGFVRRAPFAHHEGSQRTVGDLGAEVDDVRSRSLTLVGGVLTQGDARSGRSQRGCLSRLLGGLLVMLERRLRLVGRRCTTASALQQMTLLQSAIFDTGEMATAIAAWKAKRAADFDALAPVAKV